MKTITTIILGILLISCISAIYAGETIYYDFTNEVDIIQSITWEVTDNSSNLEGLNITTNTTGAILSIAQDYKPDNFTITFTITGENEEIYVETSRQGGGSSCSYDKEFDWACSEWNECIDGTQTRTCKEYNNCRNTYGKPDETKSCLIIENETIEETEEPLIINEVEKSNVWKYVLWIGILIIAIGGTLYLIIRSKE